MISLIGSVLGLVSSIGPGMYKEWMTARSDARDKIHELAMHSQISTDKRDEAIIAGAGYQNIAVQTTAQTEMKNASRWTVNYATSVRPTITYLVFVLFCSIHVAAYAGWITPDQYKILMAGGSLDIIMSTVIMFWFGQRLTSKWTR